MTYKLLASCGVGACPAVYAEDRWETSGPTRARASTGKGDELLIIGTKVEELPDKLKGKVGPEETIVKIPRSVLLGAAHALTK